MVERILNDRGVQKTVTHGWWESFCHRHPNVSLRTTTSLSLSRAKASDISVVNKYFDLLQSTVDEYDLHDKPCQLFNVNETGMPLNPKTLKMVCGTGLGTHRLCWHNFEHNRYLKALSIMLA